VPGSDGAGTVTAVGAKVSEWKEGDKVLTLFNQGHQAGPVRPSMMGTGVGGVVDGTLRQYGVYDQTGLVAQPKTLDAQQASTLTCAAVTAWNALYGLESKRIIPGQWVLTQGTGGVSMFALQFAKAAGCKVVATTSSSEKAKKLKDLGADVIINYKETPNWGEEAQKAANNGEGVDHVIEVGGPKTMAQSLSAIRQEGVISIIGFVGGQQEKQPTFLDCLGNLCIARGVYVGSKLQFQEMNAAIDANNIKPVVDEKVYELKQLKEAYQHMVCCQFLCTL
jgi:NADPH:quinone reductase-like Zn-dependent oxidoreductase